MRASELLRWGDLDERRRRRASGPLARVPLAAWSLLAGVGLIVWLADEAGLLSSGLPIDWNPDAVVGVLRIWLAAVIAGCSLAIFGAPFRMYWRRDSALLARLPIGGDALFRVAVVRSIRQTTALLAGPALVAVALGPMLDWQLALRHLALVGAAWAGGALLGPAVALGAGAMVASEKVDAVLANMGGEFQAPKTGWIGILPGLAATGVVLAVIASANWALGAPETAVGSPLIALAPPVAVSLLALLWALPRAERAMLPAIREVAALDQERLAHVEVTRPSPLESLAAGLVGARAARIVDKDARLTRRRYPLPYFLSLCGLIALWIVAAVVPGAMLTWAAVIAAFLGAYAVVMARRRAVPPVEHRRLLASLPYTAGDVARAKRGLSVLWIAVYLAAGTAPVIARAPRPLTAGAVLGAIAALVVVAALGSAAGRDARS